MAVSPLPRGEKTTLICCIMCGQQTPTAGRQQAGTLLMHRLRSHLSGSHCCLMTGSAGSIFSGFRLVLRRVLNLPEPAAGGIRLPLPPLVRLPGGEDKDGEGLEKGEKD